MSRREEIEQDLATYFEKEESLTRTDKKELLRLMFNKHFLLSHGEVLLSKHDFNKIISDAKGIFARDSASAFISGKKLEGHELVNLAIIESTISQLNFKDALKRKPSFE